jgi:hypothetical protein
MFEPTLEKGIVISHLLKQVRNVFQKTQTAAGRENNHRTNWLQVGLLTFSDPASPA